MILPRPVAYVLGGGGSLGAIQVGILQALGEHDVAPDLVVGTSVGSLNARSWRSNRAAPRTGSPTRGRA